MCWLKCLSFDAENEREILYRWKGYGRRSSRPVPRQHQGKPATYSNSMDLLCYLFILVFIFNDLVLMFFFINELVNVYYHKDFILSPFLFYYVYSYLFSLSTHPAFPAIPRRNALWVCGNSSLPLCGFGVRDGPSNVGPVKPFDTDTMERTEFQTDRTGAHGHKGASTAPSVSRSTTSAQGPQVLVMHYCNIIPIMIAKVISRKALIEDCIVSDFLPLSCH